MPDPETVIVKGGVIVLAAMSVVRLVWHDFHNLIGDLRSKKRHTRRIKLHRKLAQGNVNKGAPECDR